MRVIRIGERKIGEGEPAFIVAEAGSNHDGKLRQAKKLIDIARSARADAVKFQLFHADSLYPQRVGKIPVGSVTTDFYKLLKKNEIPRKWLSVLKEYAEKQDLQFLCSCFDEESADFLDDLGIVAHKIASPELNHIPLITHVAKKEKPLILSTGLSLLGEIEETLLTYQKHTHHGQVVLLHCISAYPTPLGQCNLNVIRTLKLVFETPVGFSDHTSDPTSAPVTAVAAGASVIEKHVTLSRTLPGPDHSFAVEPDELKRMVDLVRTCERSPDPMKFARDLIGRQKVKKMMGSGKKIISPAEKPLYPNDKRSIHAIRNIERGEPFSRNNIRVLRSERNLVPGIHPRYFDMILGKVATADILSGEGVSWNMLLSEECSH
ncbi:MAG: N-acetylneuraminate synthase family protein [Methanomicrobiales archaeon]|nr:N-acetylneuraminate synthase family protein [Methanomicrobiales archaeon]